MLSVSDWRLTMQQPSHKRYRRGALALAFAGVLSMGLVLAPSPALASEQDDQVVEQALIEEDVTDTQEPLAGSDESEAASDGEASVLEQPALNEEQPAVDEAGSEATAEEVPSGEPVTDEATQPQPEALAEEATPAEEPSDAEADTELGAEGVTPPVRDGSTFGIESAANEAQVVEAAGGKTANKTNIQTYSYNGSAAQKWKFVMATVKKTDKDGNVTTTHLTDDEGNQYYSIYLSGTSQVLDVAGGKAASRTNVDLYRYNGTDAQLWKLRDLGKGLYTIISKLSEGLDYDLVLDIADGKTTNGANLQLYRSNGSAAQKFYLLDLNPKVAPGDTSLASGVYSVKAKGNTGYVTDIKSGSKDNGANVQLYKSNGSAAQQMVITADGKGYYVIGVMGSARVFDIAGGKIVPGTNVQQYAYNGTDAQKWALRVNGDGSFSFINKKSGLALDIAGGSYANGTNIRVYRQSGQLPQSFVLTKVAKSDTELIKSGLYTISSTVSTKAVLDIKSASTADGAGLQAYGSNGSNAQKFQLIRVADNEYIIRTAASGGWLTGSTKGAQITQQGDSRNSSTADHWKITFDRGGYFTLKNVKTGLVLDLRGGKTTNGTAAQLHTSNNSAAQHFFFNGTMLSIKNGNYVFNNGISSRVMDVSGGKTTAGTNIQTHTKNGTEAQRFRVEKSGSYYKIFSVKSGLAISVSSSSADGTHFNVTQEKATGGRNQLWIAQIGDDGAIEFVSASNGNTLISRDSSASYNVVTRDCSNANTARPGRSWKLSPVGGWTVIGGVHHYINDQGIQVTRDGYAWKLLNNQVKSLEGKYKGTLINVKADFANSRTKYYVTTSIVSCRTIVWEKSSTGEWVPKFDWLAGTSRPSPYGSNTTGRYYFGASNGGKTAAENAAGGINRSGRQEQLRRGFYATNGDGKWHEGWGVNYGIFCVLDLAYHSTAYGVPDSSQLGHRVSHGCIRHAEANAKWLFNNAKNGTRCWIYM